ncbi:MAG: transglutaminase-like domain-containing protein [Aureispira sp.]
MRIKTVCFNHYLLESPLLDYQTTNIQALIIRRKWLDVPLKKRLQLIYNFVREEILFGYNAKDNLPASRILEEGIGQCNTKSTLLMALLRACQIPCRLHGFTIHKALQKGAITGLNYWLAPPNILHTWVEVNYEGQWYNLEGVILDQAYLEALQERFKDCATNFCGYGVYTEDLLQPVLDWEENDTYIQALGINQDFGLFDTPDDFYQKHQQALSPIKEYIFQHWSRYKMNHRVQQIRSRSFSTT